MAISKHKKKGKSANAWKKARNKRLNSEQEMIDDMRILEENRLKKEAELIKLSEEGKLKIEPPKPKKSESILNKVKNILKKKE